MSELRDHAVRVWAFFRKEVVEILRQPRLVLSLVLAPFLILGLFGLGYRQEVDPLKTIFVANDDSFTRLIESRVEELGNAIDYQGTSSSRAEAVEKLRGGEIDVVVVVPQDPEGTVRANEQAVFEVVHDKLDPFEQATIRLITQAAVDTVNRSIVEDLVAEGQERSEQASVAEARQLATAMREAAERGDQVEAQAHQAALDAQLETLEGTTSSADSVLSTLQADQEVPDAATVRQRNSELDLSEAGPGELEAISAIEADLAELDEALSTFRSIEPEVIVSPFSADSDLLGSLELDVTDFYAPGVIALLLQHLAVTFAGLSLVRERALGTTEIFKVAPLRATQLLLGKYLGYIAVATVLAAALSGLMFYGFGVPFVGSVGALAVILALLIVASLGIGFVISSIASTDTQAVNASMIVLLLSIFFSGFFLSLDRLLPQVRTVSWMLPITHAIDSLRDVLFRGSGVDLRTLVALGGGAVLLFFVASYFTRRRLAAE